MRWLLACVGLVFAVGVVAQDFRRAETFGQRFSDKVRNERVSLQWLPTGKAWFVRDTANGGKEFMVVDPAKKAPELAFDHARVLASLNQFTQENLTALPKSRARLSDDLKTATFFVKGDIEIDLRTFEARKGDAPSTGLQAFSPDDVVPMEEGGEPTSIQFYNRSSETLRIFWLEPTGNLREYGKVAPGERWSTGTYMGHYWLITREDGTKLAVYKPDLRGSEAILDGKRVPGTPRTAPGQSPDGKHRLTFANHQAVLNGVPITTTGTAQNRFQGPAMWAPDSQTVAFYQVVPEERRPLHIVITTPRDQFQPKLLTQQYLKPGDRVEKPVLHLYRVSAGRLIRVADDLYPNPFNLLDEAWADSNRFLFRYNARGHQTMRLIEVNATTGAARTVVNETAKTFIDWTGKSAYHLLANGREAIWQSERSGWSHLYLVDLQTGKTTPITRGEWVVREIESIDEDRREILFKGAGRNAGEDPYHVHYYRVKFDGSGLTALTEGDGTHRIEFSPDGRYLVDTYSRVNLPPVHVLRNGRTGAKIMELGKADASELLKAGFRMPRPFRAKGRDGVTDIWGLVYLPTDFDPAKKYPVVEDIYAGPHDAHVPKAFHTDATGMRLAELGFIVVRIDGMGTSQRSKAFHDVCWQNLADAGFPDRKLWMRALAREIPAMDLTRVGIYGTSAGGQNALHAVLLHGDFYKAVVADCGCYDNRMDKIWWNEQWMGWPVGPHYEAQSGRTLAPRLNGKLMLMLGEGDTNVDPASTWQVVDALINADKDFELLVLPNVGHGAIGHPYARRKFYAFFREHLGLPR